MGDRALAGHGGRSYVIPVRGDDSWFEKDGLRGDLLIFGALALAFGLNGIFIDVDGFGQLCGGEFVAIGGELECG